MNTTISIRAPAKLNLMLHITGRRTDGYHELQSVFQLIDLSDELSFSRLAEPEIIVSGNTAVDPQQDLIYRAARLLQQQFAQQSGVHIRINKNIPMGGGLGGGSSDAAATLLVLNRLWNLQLSQQNLSQIGLSLGADIPFFIFGHNAWVEGIGERLQPAQLPASYYLVIHPNVFVSTAEIFSSKHLTRDCHPITIRAFLDGSGENVCEPVVRDAYPEVDKALNWLNQFANARLTGTGACIFAAFADQLSAEEVARQVPAPWQAFIAPSLEQNPVQLKLASSE